VRLTLAYGICQQGQNGLIMPCFASIKPIFSATRRISGGASESPMIVARAFFPGILNLYRVKTSG